MQYLLRLSPILALACLSIGLTACNNGQSTVPTLSNTLNTPEAVCQRVLDALALADTMSLHGMILTRFEHDSILVPLMPISNDTAHATDLELAWYMLNQRSIKGIRRALADYEGKNFKLVSVEFTRPHEKYGPLTLHKGTDVRVQSENGEEVTLGIFGSIIEQAGRYKLVSIRD